MFSAATTEHSGIWVGLLVTSLKDITENTQDKFHTVFRALSTHFRVFVLHTLDETFKSELRAQLS